jgi:hypothetical protein
MPTRPSVAQSYKHHAYIYHSGHPAIFLLT